MTRLDLNDDDNVVVLTAVLSLEEAVPPNSVLKY